MKRLAWPEPRQPRAGVYCPWYRAQNVRKLLSGRIDDQGAVPWKVPVTDPGSTIETWTKAAGWAGALPDIIATYYRPDVVGPAERDGCQQKRPATSPPPCLAARASPRRFWPTACGDSTRIALLARRSIQTITVHAPHVAEGHRAEETRRRFVRVGLVAGSLSQTVPSPRSRSRLRSKRGRLPRLHPNADATLVPGDWWAPQTLDSMPATSGPPMLFRSHASPGASAFTTDSGGQRGAPLA